MQHKAVGIFSRQGINFLLIGLGAQSGHHQGLGFAASEQHRAVCAWQYIGADADWTHGTCITAINPWFTSQNLTPYHRLRGF